MKQMRTFLKSFDYMINILAALSAAILLFIMLAVCVDVVAKDLMGRTLTWVLEFAGYSLLYITFLGTAWVLKVEGHVSIDMFLNHLNPKNRAVVNAITSTICAIACIFPVIFGVYTSWDHYQRGLYQPTVVEMPDIALYPVIPLGFACLSIQFMRRAYSNLISWRSARVCETGSQDK